eukprot:Plantae.Rhodophyta-Rhodochaete_pulchella.ctg1648.p1 GENE.Plantae.Rhodophyta-Rhodochaete_pulchella.ctg1648~~Plantae.Rhodophyta-Rhodochaete_pulchella.ctg1648.p1  ORF type:complete len:348 (-),score=45.22 Plantae.Rhodophyta-Rhodochaete_pulchella.ctg1648:1462-2418(-)
MPSTANCCAESCFKANYTVVETLDERKDGKRKVFLASRKADGRYVVVKMFNLKRMSSVQRHFLKSERRIHEYITKLANSSSTSTAGRERNRILKMHVVEFLGYFEDDRTAYFVTEYGGEDAWEILRRYRSGFRERYALRLITQLLRVLVELHTLGIAHRDLKLPNVVLDSEDPASARLKVIDFGLSAHIPHEDDCRRTDVVGTIIYFSPELARYRGPYCPHLHDVWTVGVMLYAMCSGKMPFQGRDTREVKASICNRRLSFSSSVWKSVSRSTMRLIAALLAKKSRERISARSALHMAEGIRYELQTKTQSRKSVRVR